MRKTWKRALSFVLSAAMVLTAGAFASDVKSDAADATKTYKATLGGQMNTDIAKGIDEWGFSAETDFKLGEEATISWSAPASSDVLGCFSGNFIGIDSDLPWEQSGLYCKVLSVKFDDKEVAGVNYDNIVFDRENEQKTTERITLINKFGGIDPGMFPEDYDFTELTFKKLDVSFIISDKPFVDPWFTAELSNNGGIFGWTGGPATDDVVKVDVTGYGDYTLKAVASEDFSNGQGAMWISTNLAAVPKDYTIVGKTIKVGSKSYDWSKKGKVYLDEANVRLGIWNQWNANDEANPVGDIEGSKGDIFELTFTVKENPAPTPSAKPSTGPATKIDGLAKGKSFKSGSLTYKVTKAATITGTKRTAGAVTVTGLSKKKAASVNVKNTVKRSATTYKVTAINKNAFKKASKLKKATLGTAIKKIPANAFNGCKKLTKVTAKGVKKIDAGAFKGCKALKSLTTAKLSSVKKGAFKGCKKTIKVGGKKAVKKANVKKLKKAGYKKFK